MRPLTPSAWDKPTVGYVPDSPSSMAFLYRRCKRQLKKDMQQKNHETDNITRLHLHGALFHPKLGTQGWWRHQHVFTRPPSQISTLSFSLIRSASATVISRSSALFFLAAELGESDSSVRFTGRSVRGAVLGAVFSFLPATFF